MIQEMRNQHIWLVIRYPGSVGLDEEVADQDKLEISWSGRQRQIMPSDAELSQGIHCRRVRRRDEHTSA